jgi:phytoene synthase
VDLQQFTETDKRKIELDIEADLKEALKGIRELPRSARRGVFWHIVIIRSYLKKLNWQVPALFFQHGSAYLTGAK